MPARRFPARALSTARGAGKRPGGGPRLATRAASVLIGLALLSAPAGAQSWRGNAGEAGIVSEDGRALLALACAGPGAVTLFAANPGLTLAPGRPASLVLAVDGTVFLFEAGADGEGLVAQVSGARAGQLVAALRQGAAVELRLPAGRYELPLKGSGAALAPLDAACGPW